MTEMMPWDRFPDEDEELPYEPPAGAPPLAPESQSVPVPSPEPVKPIDDVIERVIPTERWPTAPDLALVEDDIDIHMLANQAFKQALDEALPDVKRNAMDMLKASLQATVKGQEVDWSHPTIIATTAKGKELVVADAKNRSWRTFLQGLAIDCFFALVVVLGTVTQIDTPLNKTAWIAVAALVIKTLIQTAVSYVMRLKIQPTMKNEQGEKMAIMPVPRPMLDEKAA